MLTVTVEKVSDRDVTITGIAGALLHPDTNVLIKNVRNESFSVYRVDAHYLAVNKSKAYYYLARQRKIGDSICLLQRVSGSDLRLRIVYSMSMLDSRYLDQYLKMLLQTSHLCFSAWRPPPQHLAGTDYSSKQICLSTDDTPKLVL
jgi:hypothetical protein